MELEPRSLHERIKARWLELRTERAPWKNLWHQISEYTRPDTGLFTPQSSNRPQSSNKILNSVAADCIHTLGAGLLAGVSSPSRPWFNISIRGIDLSTDIEAREWTSTVRDILLETFAKSNVYLTLQTIYEEMATYGTAACLLLEAVDGQGIRLQPLTAGEFAIATNPFGEVNTLYREFRMTAGELVQRFGYDKVSESTQDLYRNSRFDEWVNVVHAIEPRWERDVSKSDNRNMAYGSYYFEENARTDEFLEESGFDYFPALCPRWFVKSGDIYGWGPGIDSLPDIKQIQLMEKRKLQAIDLSLNPPLQGPTTFRSRTINNFPGGYTPIDNANNPIRSLVDVKLDYQGLIQVEQEAINRVKRNFFNDFFLMLANDPDGNKTATEINERRQEKMMVIGPVLLRTEPEIHKPLVVNTFNILVKQGLIPEPPQQIQQLPIDIEFVSLLAQAQKSSDLTQLDRIVSAAQALAQADPTVLDVINYEVLFKKYAALMDVPPDILRPDQEVQALREQRQQQQEQMAQAQVQQQQAQAAGNLMSAAGKFADQSGLTLQQMSGF